MPSSLVSLSAELDPGWIGDSVGYYIHRGRVYLDGLIQNVRSNTNGSGLPATTQTILTGLPPAVRPSAPVSLVLPVAVAGTDYPANPVLNPPRTLGATVQPDGTLTLDAALPDQYNNIPPESEYFYVYVSGPLQTAPSYTFVLGIGLILGALSWTLAPQSDVFTPRALAPFLLPDFTDISSGFVPHGERVHLTGEAQATRDGSDSLATGLPADALAGIADSDTHYTVAKLPDGSEIGLEVSDPSGIAVIDNVLKPRSQSPPLAWASPPWVADFRTTGGVSFNYQSISPAGTQAGEASNGQSLDYGTYLCGGASCRTPGGLPSLTLSLDDLLSRIKPQPQWFMLHLDFFVDLTEFAQDGCSGDQCGPILPVNFSYFYEANAPFTIRNFDGSVTISNDDGIQGWAAPNSPQYTGLSELPFLPGADPPANQPGFIWKWGQLTGDITIVPTGTVNVAFPTLDMFLYPLYSIQQIGLFAGDRLNLDGAGWAGVPKGGIAPGDVQAGHAVSGTRRRRRIAGRRERNGVGLAGVPLPGAGEPPATTSGLSGPGSSASGPGRSGTVR